MSFCSCSSEAYNLLASALNLGANDEVVITDLDFPAGATPWLNAAQPPNVKLWKAKAGALDANDLPALLNERTRLVQVSLVSFFNGHRLDWAPFIAAVREHAPRAKDFTNKKGARNRPLSAEDKSKNRTKSRIWAKAEHPFLILKRIFGFNKVRYRGLDKNANRLFVACGLVNLYMARRRLLRPT